jgi:hypothetical protein
MGWVTLYIQGKPGFQPEVLRHLEHSEVEFMSGATPGDSIALYWVSEDTNLRDFKKAIGSKTIFKYRLYFFTSQESLQEFSEKASNEFTPQEEAMVRTMNDWQGSHHPYKHTA